MWYWTDDPVGGPIGNPIWDSLGNPLGHPIGNPIRDPIGSPIGDPKGNLIGDPIGYPMGNPIRDPTPAQIPGLSIIFFIIRSSESLENQNRNSDFQLPPSPSRDLGSRGRPVWASSGAPGTFPKKEKKKKISDFQKKLILQRT